MQIVGLNSRLVVAVGAPNHVKDMCERVNAFSMHYKMIHRCDFSGVILVEHPPGWRERHQILREHAPNRIAVECDERGIVVVRPVHGAGISARTAPIAVRSAIAVSSSA